MIAENEQSHRIKGEMVFIGLKTISADGRVLATYDNIRLFLRDPDPEVVKALRVAKNITLASASKIEEEE